MKIISEITAKKYARAFLNLFESETTEELLKNVTGLLEFLHKHPETTIYLELPSITDQRKSEFINALVAKFCLDKHIHDLAHILRIERRFFLLPSILRNIINLHNSINHITNCTIQTSHNLTSDEKNKLISFASTILETEHIRATFVVNPELICGIRIETNALLWEQSINKTLRQTENLLFQRAQL